MQSFQNHSGIHLEVRLLHHNSGLFHLRYRWVNNVDPINFSGIFDPLPNFFDPPIFVDHQSIFCFKLNTLKHFFWTMWIPFLLGDGAKDIKTHKILQSTHNPASLEVFVELPVCMPIPCCHNCPKRCFCIH